jgi:DNA replication licensing factor MCM5
MLCSAATGLGTGCRHEKKYIQYCKAGALLDFRRGRRSLDELYVKIRDGPDVPLLPPVALGDDDTQAAIPLPFVSWKRWRLSESLARMRLDDEVQSQDVTEAL